MVGSQPARAALLAVARARPRDPHLLHARAPGARDRGHRRRSRDEPFHHAPLRDHARGTGLSRAGRVAQVPPRPGRHQPGHVRALNATGLREHGHPYLDELRQRTGYTVSLAVLDGPEILYVDRARSLRRGQRTSDLGLAPGSRLPAYATAIGKLLLANLPEREQGEILASMKLTKRGPLVDALTPHLVSTADRISARLGYRRDDES